MSKLGQGLHDIRACSQASVDAEVGPGDSTCLGGRKECNRGRNLRHVQTSTQRHPLEVVLEVFGELGSVVDDVSSA